METVGRGVLEGYLSAEEVSTLVQGGLAKMPVDGRRVLVIIR
jgi:hypothetical protein